ncbi:MAG: GNAT family N-acetyltransferase [Rikenellaceae bacterium]
MISRVPITRENQPLFVKCWNLYVNAFPEEERRTKEYHLDTLKKIEFNFEAILDDEKFVGILCWWSFESIRYIEHFATSPELRGAGYGKIILEQFIKENNKPVILEVELPDCTLNKRRIAFYERLGFIFNDCDYAHPPYSNKKDDEFLNLKLMTYPKSIDETDVDKFKEQFFPIIHFRYFEDFGI